MKVIVAIDSFKGCLSSAEANRAAAEGIRRVCGDAEVVQVAVSDGGEGFVEAFRSATGGREVEVTVADPLLRPVAATYLLSGQTAVIEIAKASGLTLLASHERNPMTATSYGTGQMVADAVEKGARHIIVGLGGSATSDAGTGMLRALVDIFAPHGGMLRALVDIFAPHGKWKDMVAMEGIRFTIATDVSNPLCGENGAASVFGPQKGATPYMTRLLDSRARHFAEASARYFGYDRSEDEGAGAAGGLGYAFMQYLNAERRSGIELLLEAIDFRKTAKNADFIVTGEGSADRQTIMGKLPMGILAHSPAIPVCLIAGQVSDRDKLLDAGFASVECINPPSLPLTTAMQKGIATQNIEQTAARLASCYMSEGADE